MGGKEALVALGGVLLLAVVVLGIVAAITYNSAQNRDKDVQQFKACIDSGGTYVKNGHNPICAHN